MNKAPPSLTLLLAALSAIGPFAIDTYLPAFPAIGRALGASEIEVQQSLTAYMLPFAFMMLWHGALSDALGRRRIILVGLVLFFLATLFCAFAPSIHLFLVGRALQGLSAGIGMVVGRAMVRDLLDGAEAQRQMAHIAILFAVAPAIAPVIGGWLLHWFDWHGIFFFLAGFTALLFAACWRWLPETLAADRRQSLHPLALAKAYGEVFSDRRFVWLSIANAFNFGAGFLYVLAAPVFLMRHLGLSSQSFAWMFVPVVIGMMLGSMVSARLAGRLSAARTVALAYGIMAAIGLLNLGINLALPPSLPWTLLPLPLFTFGMSLAMPSLQMLALDLFPERRGMASSCLGAGQTGLSALSAAVIVPLLWGSTLHLAAGMVGFLVVGCCAFAVSQRYR